MHVCDVHFAFGKKHVLQSIRFEQHASFGRSIRCFFFNDFHIFKFRLSFFDHKKRPKPGKRAHLRETLFRNWPQNLPQGPLRPKKVSPEGDPFRVLTGAQLASASRTPCVYPGGINCSYVWVSLWVSCLTFLMKRKKQEHYTLLNHPQTLRGWHTT